MIKQVVIRDNVNNITCGGICLEDGSIICGHCGHLIDKDFIGDDKLFTILEGFESWIDLSPLICECSLYYKT